MFGFKRNKADVLDHWIGFADNFQTSALEFYAAIEEQLKLRKVPGLEMNRVEFAEGGALSGKRTYLRMLRERLVFDVCAAPFGTSYFFSCRFAEIPAVVQLWQVLLLLGVLSFFGLASFYMFTRVFGAFSVILWPLASLTTLIVLIYLLRNLVALGLKDLDASLIKTPFLGPIYEAWFRKETYYRQDTRLMYLEVVSRIVRTLAEDATAAKGVKLVRQYEQTPILGELYKPVPPRGGTEPAG
jgi:hypothetical protein